jgi:hypothetical protein
MRQGASLLSLNYILGAEGRGRDAEEGQGAGYKIDISKSFGSRNSWVE